MNIVISIGEALDRLSILEIKMTEFIDPLKKHYVQKEIDSLNGIMEYKTTFSYYYNLLYSVNKLIWDKTNIIKSEPTSLLYARVAKTIFDLNQSRFRLKNVINRQFSSGIQEQKSYALTYVHIVIDSASDVDVNKLTYLSLNYDIVNIKCRKMVMNVMDTIFPFNYTFDEFNCDYTNIRDVLIPNDYITIILKPETNCV
jgi:hypothetical protein